MTRLTDADEYSLPWVQPTKAAEHECPVCGEHTLAVVATWQTVYTVRLPEVRRAIVCTECDTEWCEVYVASRREYFIEGGE